MHPLLFLAAWSRWVTLALFTNSQQHFMTRPPAVGTALLSWVLESQSLAVSLSSRPFGTCFIHHIQWFQCQLLSQNHSCRSILGTSSVLTSQTSRTHKPFERKEITIFGNTYLLLVTVFHAQLECSLLCRCTDLWHLHNVNDIGLPCQEHLTLIRQSSRELHASRRHVLPPWK